MLFSATTASNKGFQPPLLDLIHAMLFETPGFRGTKKLRVVNTAILRTLKFRKNEIYQQLLLLDSCSLETSNPESLRVVMQTLPWLSWNLR